MDIKIFGVAHGQGIETIDLSHSIKEAFRNGAKTVWVDLNPNNLKAIALYKRLGFQIKDFPKLPIIRGRETKFDLYRDSQRVEGNINYDLPGALD